MEAKNELIALSNRELRTELRDRKRFRVPPSKAGQKEVFLICHYCGFSPPDRLPSGHCPKCGGSSWERYALSSRLVPSHMR